MDMEINFNTPFPSQSYLAHLLGCLYPCVKLCTVPLTSEPISTANSSQQELVKMWI